MRPEWLTAEVLALLGAGLVVTIVITVVTTALAMMVGVGLVTLRLADRRWIRAAATTFVEVFRNIPALIQIIFWAFAFPNLFAPDTRRILFFDNGLVDALGDLTGLAVPYYAVAASFALVLNTGAHLGELFRAGVGTVAREHVDAARSLGARRREVFWRILLPDGMRAAFPAITTRLVHNLKNTALASFVAVPELFHAVQAEISRSFRATEFLTLAALLYLALAYAMTFALGRIEAVLHRGRRVRAA